MISTKSRMMEAPLERFITDPEGAEDDSGAMVHWISRYWKLLIDSK